MWFNDFSFKFSGCTIFISFTVDCVILIIDNIPFSSQDSLSASPNKFAFFLVPLLYTVKTKQLLQNFVKLQVVSSDFSMIKNIVVSSFLSSLSMKLVC